MPGPGEHVGALQHRALSPVLQSPEGPYVLAWSGHDYTFEKRPIEIGETFLKQGFAVVLSGLQPNDRVVARATFFVDADRRLGAQRRARSRLGGAVIARLVSWCARHHWVVIVVALVRGDRGRSRAPRAWRAT